MKNKLGYILFITLFSLTNFTPVSFAVDTPDKIVQGTENKDELILKNVGVNKFSYVSYFEGTLVNNSNKTWASIELELILSDKDGNLLKKQDGTPFILKTGLIRPGENRFYESINENLSEAKKFELKFYKGDYVTDYKFSILRPVPGPDLKFEDSNISSAFQVIGGEIAFSIQNKTEEPIEIDWNKFSFVDVSSKSNKVIHAGVKFSEMEKAQTEIVIPPLARFEDVILPTDNVYYSDSLKSWQKVSIFPSGYDSAKLFKGKTFSLFMPLKINEKVKNYFFTFKIDDVIPLDGKSTDIIINKNEQLIKEENVDEMLPVEESNAIDIKIKSSK